MLILSAITTSIDSFLIGITLKKTKYQHKAIYFSTFFITSFLVFITLHLLFNFIPINFNNSILKFTCFFFFGCLNLKNEENSNVNWQKITFLILIIVNSLDGFLVSLLYRTTYNIFFLSFLFSSTSLLFLILGSCFTPKKKNQWLSPFLYFSLAFLSII